MKIVCRLILVVGLKNYTRCVMNWADSLLSFSSFLPCKHKRWSLLFSHPFHYIHPNCRTPQETLSSLSLKMDPIIYSPFQSRTSMRNITNLPMNSHYQIIAHHFPIFISNENDPIMAEVKNNILKHA